jgi:hypothetical protein
MELWVVVASRRDGDGGAEADPGEDRAGRGDGVVR